jgi:hypothetical protein
MMKPSRCDVCERADVKQRLNAASRISQDVADMPRGTECRQKWMKSVDLEPLPNFDIPSLYYFSIAD